MQLETPTFPLLPICSAVIITCNEEMHKSKTGLKAFRRQDSMRDFVHRICQQLILGGILSIQAVLPLVPTQVALKIAI